LEDRWGVLKAVALNQMNKKVMQQTIKMEQYRILASKVGFDDTGLAVTGDEVTVVVVVLVVVEVGVGGLIPSQSFEIRTSAQFQNCSAALVTSMGCEQVARLPG
jgi:hypothetical protein